MSKCEEAVEALARVHYESVREPHMPPYDEVEPGPNGGDPRAGFRQQASLYADAIPAIRKQERERVLKEAAERQANLKACAENVIHAWDNPSPGAEKWDRLRQKIKYLREAVR